MNLQVMGSPFINFVNVHFDPLIAEYAGLHHDIKFFMCETPFQTLNEFLQVADHEQTAFLLVWL